MSFPKYLLNLLAATILPPLLAAAAVVACSVLTGALHVGVTALTYQRIGAAPPFVVQTLLALALGFLVSKRIGDARSARWVWVIPAAWMLVGIISWLPATTASTSAWEYFFSPQWLQLPPSPLRSHWVTAQFTHTVPLFTAVAYSMGAFLQSRRFEERPKLVVGN